VPGNAGAAASQRQARRVNVRRRGWSWPRILILAAGETGAQSSSRDLETLDHADERLTEERIAYALRRAVVGSAPQTRASSSSAPSPGSRTGVFAHQSVRTCSPLADSLPAGEGSRAVGRKSGPLGPLDSLLSRGMGERLQDARATAPVS